MGFKVFGKKDGKRTVSDNPENRDAKVTEAAKVLPEGDPATVKEGTIIRFLWDPSTGNTYCWIQGEVSSISVSPKKVKKGKIMTNKVTLKDLVLVECYGEEYNEKLPETIKIELNPQQTWALGPEATLGTEEENEVVQVDMDSIPRVIQWGNNDVAEALETKGAAGGIPMLDLRNNSVTQNLVENAGNYSSDESSGDESVNNAKEAREARIQRNSSIYEWLTDKNINEILQRVKTAAHANKGLNNGLSTTVVEACLSAQRGMDQAFIAGALSTATGEDRNDSSEYSRQKSHKVKLEAAAKARTYLKEAKRRIKILEEEEFEKLRLLISPDVDTFTLTKEMLSNMKAIAKNSLKLTKDVSRHPEGLGAVRRTQSNPRYPDLKVTFGGTHASNDVTPSAPYKEDLADSNEGPPKYESLQKKSEPSQVVMQLPGSIKCNIPPPQPPPTNAWPQHGGAFQYPGPVMNPMHAHGQ